MTETGFSVTTRVLHWATLVILVALLASGLATEAQSKAGAAAVGPMARHMILGGVMVILVVVRILRKVMGRVPRAKTRAAEIGHWALLLVLGVMGASGIGMSLLAGLPDVAFGTAVMPVLDGVAPRIVHGVMGGPLVLLVLGHAGMAVWHQWKQKDATLTRMWRGRAS